MQMILRLFFSGKLECWKAGKLEWWNAGMEEWRDAILCVRRRQGIAVLQDPRMGEQNPEFLYGRDGVAPPVLRMSNGN